MHEAELGVDQVKVVVHAFALTGTGHERMSSRVGPHVEGPRWLDDADDADEAFGYPVASRDLPGEVFFALALVPGGGMVEVDIGTPRLGGYCLPVGGDRCGRLLSVLGELLHGEALAPQERRDGAGCVEPPQVPLEDQPVEHGQAPRHPVGMDILEHGHGLVPSWGCSRLVIAEQSAKLGTGPTRDRLEDTVLAPRAVSRWALPCAGFIPQVSAAPLP